MIATLRYKQAGGELETIAEDEEVSDPSSLNRDLGVRFNLGQGSGGEGFSYNANTSGQNNNGQNNNGQNSNGQNNNGQNNNGQNNSSDPTATSMSSVSQNANGSTTTGYLDEKTGVEGERVN
jgi:hypothetical protein